MIKLTPRAVETLQLLDYCEGTRKVIKELRFTKTLEPDGYGADL